MQKDRDSKINELSALKKENEDLKRSNAAQTSKTNELSLKVEQSVALFSLAPNVFTLSTLTDANAQKRLCHSKLYIWPSPTPSIVAILKQSKPSIVKVKYYRQEGFDCMIYVYTNDQWRDGNWFGVRDVVKECNLVKTVDTTTLHSIKVWAMEFNGEARY